MLTWYFFNFWGDVLILTAMAPIPAFAFKTERTYPSRTNTERDGPDNFVSQTKKVPAMRLPEE
jgi:hypothetical protein